MESALFSASSLFADPDNNSSDEESKEIDQDFVERKHQFPGMELAIREFSFHQLNANLLWPGTFAFVEWLVEHRQLIEGRRILELGRLCNVLCSTQFRKGTYPFHACDILCAESVGSRFHNGTGALAIYLRKSFQLDITTSDYDDPDIEENIAHNCQVNGVVPVLPHIKHTWGDVFPVTRPNWDLIIASDILLYVKQYANLIKTFSFLLKSYKAKAIVADSQPSEQNGTHLLPRPAFLMSWRRRIGKEDESLFFSGCEKVGMEVHHLGSRVYCIKPGETTTKEAI